MSVTVHSGRSGNIADCRNRAREFDACRGYFDASLYRAIDQVRSVSRQSRPFLTVCTKRGQFYFFFSLFLPLPRPRWNNSLCGMRKKFSAIMNYRPCECAVRGKPELFHEPKRRCVYPCETSIGQLRGGRRRRDPDLLETPFIPVSPDRYRPAAGRNIYRRAA